jgi:hypothetical protein
MRSIPLAKPIPGLNRKLGIKKAGGAPSVNRKVKTKKSEEHSSIAGSLKITQRHIDPKHHDVEMAGNSKGTLADSSFHSTSSPTYTTLLASPERPR